MPQMIDAHLHLESICCYMSLRYRHNTCIVDQNINFLTLIFHIFTEFFNRIHALKVKLEATNFRITNFSFDIFNGLK